MRHRALRLALAGLLAATTASLLAAPGDRLAILDLIPDGNWQLREIGSTAAPRAICVRDPGMLLQVGHGASQCARFTVETGARTATIHYTCPGAGHGRTTIRVESAGLVRLQTQGIAQGNPFDYDYEARRTGACSAAR